jgi:phosphoesterase RecJ-like protein
MDNLPQLNRFKKILNDSKNIIITTHLNPDADGLGSMLALSLALKKLSKNVYCVIESELPLRYKEFTRSVKIHTSKEFQKLKGLKGPKTKSWDLMIVVDTHLPSAIGSTLEKYLHCSENFICIDHHPAPSSIQAIHLINTKAAATGEFMSTIIKFLGIDINLSMAKLLYTAILIDTSSFRYPTVSGNTHRILSQLLDKGINPALAYNNIYGTKSLNHMQLLGDVLKNAKVSKLAPIAWMTITQNQLKKFKVHEEDTHSFINHLLVLKNIKVALLFREDTGKIKISFRSSFHENFPVIDVEELARAFGGGGHQHSAATIIEGKLVNVVKKTIKHLEFILIHQKK